MIHFDNNVHLLAETAVRGKIHWKLSTFAIQHSSLQHYTLSGQTWNLDISLQNMILVIAR